MKTVEEFFETAIRHNIGVEVTPEDEHMVKIYCNLKDYGRFVTWRFPYDVEKLVEKLALQVDEDINNN